MTNCQNEMKKAVEAGYWNLFTFNPANKAQGKNPFTLTSKAVDAEKYQALLANETRYSRRLVHSRIVQSSCSLATSRLQTTVTSI